MDTCVSERTQLLIGTSGQTVLDHNMRLCSQGPLQYNSVLYARWYSYSHAYAEKVMD